jgi:hypothetical protein
VGSAVAAAVSLVVGVGVGHPLRVGSGLIEGEVPSVDVADGVGVGVGDSDG